MSISLTTLFLEPTNKLITILWRLCQILYEIILFFLIRIMIIFLVP